MGMKVHAARGVVLFCDGGGDFQAVEGHAAASLAELFLPTTHACRRLLVARPDVCTSLRPRQHASLPLPIAHPRNCTPLETTHTLRSPGRYWRAALAA